MMGHMKQRILSFMIAVGGLLLWPLVALAEDEAAPPDPRLEGYKDAVKLVEGSAALTWMLLIALAIVCVAAMFKNAKRSHLD